MAQEMDKNQSVQAAISYMGWLIANKKNDVIDMLNKSGVAVLDTSNKALAKYVSQSIANNPNFVTTIQAYQANHFSGSQNAIGWNSTKSIQQMFKNASGMTGFNKTEWANSSGNVGGVKSSWKNTFGTIDKSECVTEDGMGGCIDADGVYHNATDIIGSTYGGYGSSSSGSSSSSSGGSNGGSTSSSSGGGFFGFLGNIFTTSTVSNILNTGVGTLANNINSQNQKDILELQLQIAQATTQAEKDKLEAQKLALQQKANTSASNKWLIPIVVGGGVILIGTIIFLAVRTNK